MDLSDLSDIRRAAESLNETPKIDHLLAVAGIMVPPYGRTVDGVESQFGVNYLANFLLVKLLLPKIRAAGTSASIVIMASSAVTTGKVNFDDIGFSACPSLCDSWNLTDDCLDRTDKRMMLSPRTASPMLRE